MSKAKSSSSSKSGKSSSSAALKAKGPAKAASKSTTKAKATKAKPSKVEAKSAKSAKSEKPKLKPAAVKAPKQTAPKQTAPKQTAIDAKSKTKGDLKPNVKPTKSGSAMDARGKKPASNATAEKKSDVKKVDVAALKSGKSAKDQAKANSSSGSKAVVEATPSVAAGQSLEEMLAEAESAEELVITDADGRRFCRIRDCDQLAQVDGYCRFHYIQLWKHIQSRRVILSEGKLERYIEELTARYPDKFLEILRKDLRVEKDFLAAIAELEIDESAVEAEFEEDENQSDLYEVQRMSDAGSERAEDDSF